MDSSNLRAARTHPSFVQDRLQSYERLEFLGDAVLGLLVAEYAYRRFDGQDEGFLSRMRASIVNGAMLARLASALGLHERARLGEGTAMTDAIKEDLFEAALGALYLDRGLEAAREWLTGVLETHVDFVELVRRSATGSAKSRLNKYLRSTQGVDAAYVRAARAGGDTMMSIVVQDVNGCVLGSGRGDTLKTAELAAASAALVNLGLL
jgi:ribonuclease-3